jgi:hypothetical protein
VHALQDQLALHPVSGERTGAGCFTDVIESGRVAPLDVHQAGGPVDDTVPGGRAPSGQRDHSHWAGLFLLSHVQTLLVKSAAGLLARGDRKGRESLQFPR